LLILGSSEGVGCECHVVRASRARAKCRRTARQTSRRAAGQNERRRCEAAPSIRSLPCGRGCTLALVGRRYVVFGHLPGPPIVPKIVPYSARDGEANLGCAIPLFWDRSHSAPLRFERVRDRPHRPVIPPTEWIDPRIVNRACCAGMVWSAVDLQRPPATRKESFLRCRSTPWYAAGMPSCRPGNINGSI
jgi:hypothetical protein